MTDTAKQTKAVLRHHWQAVAAQDMSAIMEDYAPDSVMLGPDGPKRGLQEIAETFNNTLDKYGADFLTKFQLVRLDIEGDVAYVAWASGKSLVGSDTFVLRDGKIAVQTFVVCETKAMFS